MSMLQKLENLYAGLIRALTAVLTLALLACALMVGIKWMHVITDDAKTDDTPASVVPKVATSDLVARVVADETGAKAGPISSTDPNKADYDRIAKAFTAFAEKYKISEDDLDLDTVLGATKARATSQDTNELTQAYVSGIADAFEHTLTDPKIEALLAKYAANTAAPAKKNVNTADAAATAAAAAARHAKSAASDEDDADTLGEDDSGSTAITPVNVIHTMYLQFNQAFDSQSSTTSPDLAARTAAEEKQKAEKAAMTNQLARLGGALLLLILVLQALTFGRVAQNMRHLIKVGKNNA